MASETLESLGERMRRIEAKLDALLTALAEDDEDAPAFDLEGKPMARERVPERCLGSE